MTSSGQGRQEHGRKNQEDIMEKHWLRIVVIVVAVLLVIIIALPFLINVNSYRPKIEADASSALGRQVTVGNLSLSIFSGSVEADKGRTHCECLGIGQIKRTSTCTG